jgi:hypothetical protein
LVGLTDKLLITALQKPQLLWCGATVVPFYTSFITGVLRFR